MDGPQLCLRGTYFENAVLPKHNPCTWGLTIVHGESKAS